MSGEERFRVVDLSNGPMGGYATRLLAGFGAEVIKVEKPGSGDATRGMGPFPGDEPHPERSGIALYLDAAKQSVTLDIERSEGRELLDRLLGTADALVETYASAEADRLGLTYEALEPRHPRLVVTSLTPFGREGPYRDREATALTLEALSGWLNLSGEPGRMPTRTRGELVTAVIPGTFAAIGTLAALAWRRTSGEGQQVEVAAMEALIAGSRYYETTFAYLGISLPRLGNTLYPTYCYRPALDGWSALCAVTQSQRELLALVMGLGEFLDDPIFSGPAVPDPRDKPEAQQRIDRWVAEHARADAFKQAQELRIPFGYLTTADELPGLEQLVAREAFTRIDHPEAGTLELPGAPVKLGEAPFRTGRAPLLGEHNRAVYGDQLGIAPATLERMAREGVI